MSNHTTEATFKKMRNILILFCGILFILSSLILKPVYITLNSDIIYSESAFLLLLEILIELCDIFIYSSAFAVISYSVFFSDKKRSLLLILTYIIMAFVKNIIDIIMTLIIYGSIDMSDIFSVFFYIFAESALMFAVYFIALRTKSKAESDTYLPFAKIFETKNPLQLTALISAALLSVIKIVTRIIYDIFVGLPESLFEVCSMILFYSADILITAIAYAAIIFVIKRLHSKKA